MWLGKLVGYDFKIRYCSGKTNLVADALSRVPLSTLFTISRPIFFIVETIRLANQSYPKLQDLYHRLQSDIQSLSGYEYKKKSSPLTWLFGRPI